MVVYEKQKKEKLAVQVQVRLMREQLAMKKQNMINELRELRKEYRMNKDMGNESALAEVSMSSHGFGTAKASGAKYNSIDP